MPQDTIPDPTGALDAKDEANARAVAKAQEQSDAGYVGIGTPPPPPQKQNHQTKTRPADSGYVGSSPADLAQRMGGWQGGEVVVQTKPREDLVETVRSDPTTERVSAEGVPDVPALRKHNADRAEIIAATAQSQIAAGDQVTAGKALGNHDVNPWGDRSNTVEGVLAEQETQAADKAEAKAEKASTKKG